MVLSQDMLVTRSALSTGMYSSLMALRPGRINTVSSSCLAMWMPHLKRHNLSSIFANRTRMSRRVISHRVGMATMACVYHGYNSILVLTDDPSTSSSSRCGCSIRIDVGVSLVILFFLNIPINYQELPSNGPLAVDCLSYCFQCC